MMLSDEQAKKLKKLIEVFQEVAGIASSYSPCIDAVADNGGDDSEDPIERIHWLCYHTDYHINFDAQSSQQVQDEPVQPVHIHAINKAIEFIENGVEFGYIRMPDEGTPDSAHKTLPLLREALKASPTPKQEPVIDDDTLYNGASAGRVSGGLEITLFIDSEEDCKPRKVCIGDYGIESLLKTFKFYGYTLNPAPPQEAAIPEGYVLVPLEPSSEQQTVGAQAVRIDTTVLNKLFTANRVYRDMIAAAPKPE